MSIMPNSVVGHLTRRMMSFRRLAGDQLFRDFQRHALHVAEKHTPSQADSPKASPWGVADYLFFLSATGCFSLSPFPVAFSWAERTRTTSIAPSSVLKSVGRDCPSS